MINNIMDFPLNSKFPAAVFIIIIIINTHLH